MANYDKFTKQWLSKMLSHYDRTDEAPKEHIDRSRSHLNYNLAQRADEAQMDIFKKRISEVKVMNRADVNVLCCWVVTMPKTLPVEKEPEFFRNTYEFLENRYGKDNVVSAFVHKDEVSPHMHFAFIPVVQDKKRDRLKVNANECVTRLDLQKIHGELQEHLESKLGCQVDILNEATKEGNKSIAELKRESAIERLEKATAEATEIVSTAQYRARVIKDMAKPLEAEYEAVQKMIDALNAEPNKSGIKANYVYRSFKKEIESYTVEPKRMEELLTKEKSLPELEKMHKELEKDLAEIRKTMTFKEYQEAIKQYHAMNQELEASKAENMQLQRKLERYKQRYGELEEPQQSKVRQQYRSRSRERSNGYDITE